LYQKRSLNPEARPLPAALGLFLEKAVHARLLLLEKAVLVRLPATQRHVARGSEMSLFANAVESIQIRVEDLVDIVNCPAV
jgi:hypothetical protein